MEWVSGAAGWMGGCALSSGSASLGAQVLRLYICMHSGGALQSSVAKVSPSLRAAQTDGANPRKM